MQVKTIKVGYLEENCYLLINNNECLIVDPGDEFSKIESNIENNKLVGILITHHHFDHIGALEEFKTYKVPIYEYPNLEEKKYNISSFKFKVLFTPGHTSDSVTYIFDDVMFTGDFLFENSIGRTDLPTGNITEMKNSITKIKKYSDNYQIYPGHGDKTTLNEEKKNNPYLK